MIPSDEQWTSWVQWANRDGTVSRLFKSMKRVDALSYEDNGTHVFEYKNPASFVTMLRRHAKRLGLELTLTQGRPFNT